MRDAAATPEPDLGRLRRNADENYPLFCAAGLQEKEIATLQCKRCGAAERAFFWTVAGRSEGVLDLACPVCGEWHVRYDLRRNDWRTGPRWKPWAAAALVAGAAALYLGFREPVNRAALEAWRGAESRIGGMAGEQVPEAVLPGAVTDSAPPRVRE